jgi:hypothetical protein
MKEFFDLYLDWFLDGIDFMKTVILPVVIGVVLTWILTKKQKEN